MAVRRSCSALLDTSVIASAVFSEGVARVVEGLGRACSLHYSRFYTVLDVEFTRNLPVPGESVLEWAERNLADAGHLTLREESRVFGRYGKWVKAIGKIDVAIAYLAIKNQYILVTGDWRQLQFYASLHASRYPKTPLRAMYIPVRYLG